MGLATPNLGSFLFHGHCFNFSSSSCERSLTSPLALPRQKLIKVGLLELTQFLFYFCISKQSLCSHPISFLQRAVELAASHLTSVKTVYFFKGQHNRTYRSLLCLLAKIKRIIELTSSVPVL